MKSVEQQESKPQNNVLLPKLDQPSNINQSGDAGKLNEPPIPLQNQQIKVMGNDKIASNKQEPNNNIITKAKAIESDEDF